MNSSENLAIKWKACSHKGYLPERVGPKWAQCRQRGGRALQVHDVNHLTKCKAPLTQIIIPSPGFTYSHSSFQRSVQILILHFLDSNKVIFHFFSGWLRTFPIFQASISNRTNNKYILINFQFYLRVIVPIPKN